MVSTKDLPKLKRPINTAIRKENWNLGRGSLYLRTNSEVANYLHRNVTAKETISRIGVEKFY